jgi:GT2 family glycosyltransferase
LSNRDIFKVSNGVSVVIATLGGHSLLNTIKALNAGSLVPDEILVVLPKGVTLRNGFDPNVQVIFSEIKGQVAQRIFGFSLAKFQYVLQLDDDIILDINCLENLVKRCSFADRLAVGPVFIDSITSTPIYKRTKIGLFGAVYYWILNGALGYQPGKFYLSGSGEGVPPTCLSSKINIEWLAGGCVLHRRENLILENYFPFLGKAYCEDYIHSYLLAKSGVGMAIEPKSLAYLEVSGYCDFDFISLIRNLYLDFKARQYFQKIRNVSSLRIYFFYGLIFLNYLLNKIKRSVVIDES